MAESSIKKIEREKDAAVKHLEKLQKAFLEVAAAPSGRIVLKEIFRRCGYDKPSVVLQKDGGIDISLMQYREARRSLWLELRSFLENKQLKEIEYT